MENVQRDELLNIIHHKIADQPLSADQEAIFKEWMLDPENEELFKELKVDTRRMQRFLELERSARKVHRQLLSRLDSQFIPAHGRMNKFWRTWPRWAAAAIIVASASYLLLRDSSTKPPAVEQVAAITPGKDKATLTLANGQVIELNGTDSVQLADQGKASVRQVGGQLSYQDAHISAAVVYNVLSTPRGGKFILTLSDGSKLWLNSATKIRYPSSFTGPNRLIELQEGEAFLEVAKNEQQPFILKVAQPAGQPPIEVTVLGTRFNVHAYPSESTVRTTLVEGKVQISKGDTKVVLAPLQQASASTSSNNLRVITEVKVDTVIDWTLDKFIFSNAKLTTIMEKVSFWYDVDIQYVDDPNIHAENLRTGETGSIPRTMNLERLLSLLQTAGVKSELKGRTIVVYR